MQRFAYAINVANRLGMNEFSQLVLAEYNRARKIELLMEMHFSESELKERMVDLQNKAKQLN